LPNDKIGQVAVKCKQLAAMMTMIGTMQRVLFAESCERVSNYMPAIIIGVAFYRSEMNYDSKLQNIMLCPLTNVFGVIYLNLYNLPSRCGHVRLVLSFI